MCLYRWKGSKVQDCFTLKPLSNTSTPTLQLPLQSSHCQLRYLRGLLPFIIVYIIMKCTYPILHFNGFFNKFISQGKHHHYRDVEHFHNIPDALSWLVLCVILAGLRHGLNLLEHCFWVSLKVFPEETGMPVDGMSKEDLPSVWESTIQLAGRSNGIRRQKKRKSFIFLLEREALTHLTLNIRTLSSLPLDSGTCAGSLPACSDLQLWLRIIPLVSLVLRLLVLD